MPSGSPDGVLLHAQIGQDLGAFLLYRQQVVACGAVVGDRLTVRAGVRTVVAAEASREIVVAEVVRGTSRPKSIETPFVIRDSSHPEVCRSQAHPRTPSQDDAAFGRRSSFPIGAG